jgi:glycosyltransferase 2 family protein
MSPTIAMDHAVVSAPVRLNHAGLKYLGTALAIAAALFVVLRVWAESHNLSGLIVTVSVPALISAVLLYASSGGLLALGWWFALKVAGVANPALDNSAAAWLASQIGKYLPGNVGHFVARHLIASRQGARHTALVAAAVVETLVLIAASSAFALLIIGDLLLFYEFEFVQTELVWLTPLVALGLLYSGLWLGRKRGWLESCSTRPVMLSELAVALALAIVFFSVGGLCFVLMAPGLDMGDWILVLPWLAAAWLIGFMVPGAPGGLGIRELVLVLGLAPLVGQADAVMYAVMFRIVTVSGDGIMSLAGMIWLRRLSVVPG